MPASVLTTTGAAPAAPGDDRALVHLGVLHDGVDDLVARSLPEIRSVLDEGGDVRITVDRRGVRELRHALGRDADRVRFPAPCRAFAGSVPEFLGRLRRELPRDRRTLLLAQYATTTPPAWDSAHAEDAVNLVLADLPLTVLCACSRDGDAAHRQLTERSHRQLLAPDGRTTNEGFRERDAASPAPLAPWGPAVLTTTVSDGVGLSELRARVAAVAAGVGLDADARAAAVLAAHEAVLLASGGAPDTAVPLDAEHAVEVRAGAGVVVTEVRVPATGPVPPAADRRRELLARICGRLAVHHGPDGRRVRVLSTR